MLTEMDRAGQSDFCFRRNDLIGEREGQREPTLLCRAAAVNGQGQIEHRIIKMANHFDAGEAPGVDCIQRMIGVFEIMCLLVFSGPLISVHIKQPGLHIAQQHFHTEKLVSKRG